MARRGFARFTQLAVIGVSLWGAGSFAAMAVVNVALSTVCAAFCFTLGGLLVIGAADLAGVALGSFYVAASLLMLVLGWVVGGGGFGLLSAGLIGLARAKAAG